MYDQSHVMKMLSDPEIVKDVHLYVSKEKAGDDVAPPSKQFDIAPSDHPNESDIAPSNHPQSIPLEPYLLHICIDCYNCCNKS